MLKLFRKNKIFRDAEKKTLNAPIDYNFAPKEIYLTACEVALSVGAAVRIGEKIGCGTDKMPIYSGISGKVSEIVKVSDNEYRVKIENDFSGSVSDSVVPFGKENNVKVTDLTPEILIDVIEKSSIRTRGRQIAFNERDICQRIKDSFGIANRIIINCVGGEPYDTSVRRVLAENGEDLINGMKIIMAAMKIGEAAVLLDSENREEANLLSGMLMPSDNVKIVLADPSYPADNEHSAVYTLTLTELSRAKNAERAKYVVFDIRETVSVARAFVYGERETGEVVTLSGEGFASPKNVYLPYGTKISELADYADINKDENIKILVGGVLRGREAALEDVFEAGMSPVVALREKDIPRFDGIICTKCAECMRACPMLLMPMYLSFAGKTHKKKMGKRFGVDFCIECGICQYVCPSGIPILENIRKIKNVCENTAEGGGDK
jgi:electron transport complex protein RnfC